MTTALAPYASPMTESEQWLSRTEAAELLRVSPVTVDRYARQEQGSPLHLPRYRSAVGRFRYRVEDVRDLITRRDTGIGEPDNRQG